MNTDLLKIQYEIFDMEAEAIAVANSLAIKDVVNLIETHKWEKNPLITKAIDISDSKDLATVSEDYASQLKEQLDLTNLLKQKALSPSYVRLETLLIQKAFDILKEFKDDHPDAPKNLKILTSVLQDLLQNNSNLVTAKEAAEKGDNKVVVQIMNKVEKEDK